MGEKNGIILRSKAQWVEEGQKKTKYFLNLEKRNYNKKTYKKWIDDKGKEIIDQKEILKEQHNFYEKLYTTKIIGKETKFGDNDPSILTLEKYEREPCDYSFTIE